MRGEVTQTHERAGLDGWGRVSSSGERVGMTRRIRRPEFVPQMEVTDCGAACLAMSLSLFGIRFPLRELRSLVGAGRDGVTAGTIIRAAWGLGIEAAGVRIAA